VTSSAELPCSATPTVASGGTLPVEGGAPKLLGRLGGELSVEDGRPATRLAALNARALAKTDLGSLDRLTRIVRLGISLVTTPDFREHPKVADAVSGLTDGYCRSHALHRKVTSRWDRGHGNESHS
jgi:hypothetical protein